MSHVPLQGNGGNLKIVRADHRSDSRLSSSWRISALFRRCASSNASDANGAETHPVSRVRRQALDSSFAAPCHQTHRLTTRTKQHFARLDGLPAGHELRIAAWREQRDAGVGVGQVNHSSASLSSNSPCGARCNSGMEPAIRSKNPFGQPFSSTSFPGSSGFTRTTADTSASARQGAASRCRSSSRLGPGRPRRHVGMRFPRPDGQYSSTAS